MTPMLIPIFIIITLYTSPVAELLQQPRLLAKELWEGFSHHVKIN